MKRTSWITAAALGGGLALGLVFGPAITGTASAQTDTPSATPSASATTVPDTAVAPEDCPEGGRGTAPSDSVTPSASPSGTTSDV